MSEVLEWNYGQDELQYVSGQKTCWSLEKMPPWLDIPWACLWIKVKTKLARLDNFSTLNQTYPTSRLQKIPQVDQILDHWDPVPWREGLTPSKTLNPTSCQFIKFLIIRRKWTPVDGGRIYQRLIRSWTIGTQCQLADPGPQGPSALQLLAVGKV